MQSFGCYFQEWVGGKDHDTPFRIKNDKEWRDHDHIVKNDNDAWILEWAECDVHQVERQSVFVLKFGVSRDPGFYLWNVMFVHFAVVLLSAFTCAIDHADFGARAQVTYTLLLTLVAFKFVVATFVPRISYLTYMDKYSLLSLSMLGLVIAENFLVSGLFADENDTEVWKYADRVFFATFCGVWLLFHVLLVLGARYGFFYESWTSVRAVDDIHKKSKYADFCGKDSSTSACTAEGTTTRRHAWD